MLLMKVPCGTYHFVSPPSTALCFLAVLWLYYVLPTGQQPCTPKCVMETSKYVRTRQVPPSKHDCGSHVLMEAKRKKVLVCCAMRMTLHSTSKKLTEYRYWLTWHLIATVVSHATHSNTALALPFAFQMAVVWTWGIFSQQMCKHEQIQQRHQNAADVGGNVSKKNSNK